MSGRVGSITTDIIADGLVFNMDAANRASTIPSTSTTETFNTVDTSISGSIITDGTWTNSTISPSFNFDGSDGYIDISTSQTLPPNTNDFTLSGWFYRNSSSSGNPVYFEKGAAYPSNGILIRDSGAAGLIEVYYNGFGAIQFSNLTSYNTSNAWHHIALVYSESGNTLTAYIDGNSEQKPATTTLNVTDSIFIIGKRQNNTSYWYGNIGPIHIYNRALSANEVLHNYNALKSRFE